MAECENTIHVTGEARILDLLCEGPIEGIQDLYIDGVPYESGRFPTIIFDKEKNTRNGERRTLQSIMSGEFSGAKVPLIIPQSNELLFNKKISIQLDSNTYPDANGLLVNVRIPALYATADAESNLYSNTCIHTKDKMPMDFYMMFIPKGCGDTIVDAIVYTWQREHHGGLKQRYDDCPGCTISWNGSNHDFKGTEPMNYIVPTSSVCPNDRTFEVHSSAVTLLRSSGIDVSKIKSGTDSYGPFYYDRENIFGFTKTHKFFSIENGKVVVKDFVLPQNIGRSIYYKNLYPVLFCLGVSTGGIMVQTVCTNANYGFVRKFVERFPCIKDMGKLSAGTNCATFVSYDVTLEKNGVKVWETNESHFHKSSGGFVWTTRIPLNPSVNKSDKWIVTIERTVPDSEYYSLENKTQLDSVIVTTTNNYNYPNSAMAGVIMDAENYPNLATRAYDTKTLKVKIPTGYTPTQYDKDRNVTQAAIYPDVWDGTFQDAKVWTDNPAWCWYDLLTNRRYGLGEFIEKDFVDKWTLYSIAKNCDELVSNGTGREGLLGKEPRFTCNMLLTETEDAYNVMNNMASVFRGMIYWSSGKIVPVQDIPKRRILQFTNSNVENGEFIYSHTARTNRRTFAAVRWNDPDNLYRANVEYVEDIEGIIKYGRRELQLSAFACTSRSQARRIGMWALLSERMETETVGFRVALDGFYAKPGDIINIYDNFRFMQKQGGRVLKMSRDAASVTLDRAIEYDQNLKYKLSIDIPKTNRDPSYTGTSTDVKITNSTQIDDIRKPFTEERAVVAYSESGGIPELTLESGFSEYYNGGTWIIEATGISSENERLGTEYRIQTISENDDSASLSISALQFSREKFDGLESGFSTIITSNIDFSSYYLAPPTNLTLTQVNENNALNQYIDIKWTPSTGEFVDFHIVSGSIRDADSGNFWFDVSTSTQGSARFSPTSNGTYEFIVRASQIGGKLSAPISKTINFIAKTPTGQDPGQGMPIIESITIDSEDSADNTNFMNFFVDGRINYASENLSLLDFTRVRTRKRGIDPFSEWIPVDSSSNVFRTSYTDVVGEYGEPFRNLEVQAVPIDRFGRSGDTFTKYFSNPPPGFAELVIPSRTRTSFFYNLQELEPLPGDFSGVYFWLNDNPTKPSEPYTTVASLNGTINHSFTSDDVYIWWSLGDFYSDKELNISGPRIISFGTIQVPTGLNLSLNLNKVHDSLGNSYNTLNSTWKRFDSGDVLEYYIRLSSNSGETYNFEVPQTQSGTNPFFNFGEVIPDRSYQAAIQAIAADGRMSAWSTYTSPATYVPMPIIAQLNVSGNAHFNGLVSAKVDIQNFSGDAAMNFGKSTIIRANFFNSPDITINPINIQSGASYVIYAYRQAGMGAINFSSAFKWPGGESPTLSVIQGGVDVFSAIAINDTDLYAVYSNDFR